MSKIEKQAEKYALKLWNCEEDAESYLSADVINSQKDYIAGVEYAVKHIKSKMKFYLKNPKDKDYYAQDLLFALDDLTVDKK